MPDWDKMADDIERAMMVPEPPAPKVYTGILYTNDDECVHYMDYETYQCPTCGTWV